MSGDEQRNEAAGAMRQKAEQLELRAQRAADQGERERLMEKAVHLRAKCEEVGGAESATMDPM
ncbi:DUF6381 family protein [Streptomyces sp. A0592]|uniref:DUF6381 family protein n=1 Tax=Streptomyces sp. A0592 TaxID=2563099 RepID=UPI00109E8CE1|nr:DUF6381 family protein [Streptomyces sp. A0592]THA86344.1 small hydrophilic protein [Streptomyces sp. A0592]